MRTQKFLQLPTPLLLLWGAGITGAPSIFEHLQSLPSVCSASVSVPGLPDLARRAPNHLLGVVDHRERGPPVGHRRSQPGRVGAAPQFREAEVSTAHVLISHRFMGTLQPRYVLFAYFSHQG